MDKPVVFEFETFSDYFAEVCRWKKSQKKTFSYRLLASKLGLETHNNLVMIASGKRFPNQKLLGALGAFFEWSDEERAYADALIGKERAEDPREREFFAEKLVALRPYSESPVLKADVETFFGCWYNVAIFEMASLADFRPDPQWIADRMFNRITPNQASEALELLCRMEFLRVNADGTVVRLKGRLRAIQNVPNMILRDLHKQNLSSAAWSIDHLPISERYVTSVTFTMDTKRIDEAFRMIAEFRARFLELFEQTDGNQTFQFAAQLYPLCARGKDEET
jgi:uncharacterized protein (TIGR02147 family)